MKKCSKNVGRPKVRQGTYGNVKSVQRENRLYRFSCLQRCPKSAPIRKVDGWNFENLRIVRYRPEMTWIA